MRVHNGHIEDYIFIHFRAPAAEFFLNTIAENDALELGVRGEESIPYRGREKEKSKKGRESKKGRKKNNLRI